MCICGRDSKARDIPGTDITEEHTGRREDYSPSACCSQARSRSWMSWSPPAASSPVIEGKLVKDVPHSYPVSSNLCVLAAFHIHPAQGGAERGNQHLQRAGQERSLCNPVQGGTRGWGWVSGERSDSTLNPSDITGVRRQDHSFQFE